MQIDNGLRFQNDVQLLTTGASTNVVDLSIARDIGTGKQVWCVAVVTTAFTDGGSDSTMAVKLQTDNDEAFGSATDAQALGTFAALSAAGTRIAVPIGPNILNERYARLYYTVANGDLTTGKFTSFLCTDLQQWVAYANAYTIVTP